MTLIIKNVTKKYKNTKAVNDISLQLPKGEMLGFLGRNGAGKTTTFRMILGLTKITEGSITYNGDIIDKRMFNKIGYLPEERGLHAKLTVYEELYYLAKLKGMKRKEIKKAIDYWLHRFNIIENKSKKIENLSKGNQQKIQLLASIIHSPELLILDEPFSGLDPVNVNLLKSAVIDLQRNGATIIFSSHRMEHVEELCDNICILNKGEIVLSGNLDQIKNRYGHTQLLIETDNDLEDLKNVEGVIEVKRTKKQYILTVGNQEVAEKVFSIISKKGFVKHFQLMEPSLNDIFIHEVGDVIE